MVKVGDIPIRLQMVTPVNQFQDKVIRAMYAELTKKLQSQAFQQSIRRGTKQALEKALRAQPEYQSMVMQDGKLRAELGVVDSTSAMESLVRDWVRSTTVHVARPRIVGGRILGTIISVKAIQADYDDVLQKAYASYTTEKGAIIPWLDWLLTKGEAIMIQSHQIFHPAPPTARSRTQTNTIMKKTKGQGWGVPEEFSGTPDNNYATRAVAMAMPEIGQMIEAEVRRRL